MMLYKTYGLSAPESPLAGNDTGSHGVEVSSTRGLPGWNRSELQSSS